MAEADFVGLLIDGARMASPGLLARRAAARGVSPTAPGRRDARAGTSARRRHMDAAAAGYDQAAEDRLLAETRLGARRLPAVLREHARRRRRRGAGSRRWARATRCSCPRRLWAELGGLDERFALRRRRALQSRPVPPRRASSTACSSSCCSARARSIRSTGARRRRAGSRGTRCTPSTSRSGARPYRPPDNDRLYVGRVPATALPVVADSATRRP